MYVCVCAILDHELALLFLLYRFFLGQILKWDLLTEFQNGLVDFLSALCIMVHDLRMPLFVFRDSYPC